MLGERGLQRVVDHGVPAVLDDDQGTAEPLEPRQRLDEGGRLAGRDPDGGSVDEPTEVLVRGGRGRDGVTTRLCARRGGRVGGHVLYAEFSWT